MSKFQECIDTYKAEFDKLGVDYEEDLLVKVTKGCGPAIYNRDACTVSGTDKGELDTVKKNFLIKKLGLDDSEALDSAIAEVIETFGSSNKYKYRAMFYYLLTKKFSKEAIYN